MNSLVQLIICFLIITIFGNILSLPSLQRDLRIVSSFRGDLIHRVRRQGPVVQPSWSMNSGAGLFEDFNVRVTDEKLEETEAIRDYIHETVENGTYVVELDDGDFEEDVETSPGEEEIPVEELSQPGPELKVEPKQTTIPSEPPSRPEPKTAPKEIQTNTPQPIITKQTTYNTPQPITKQTKLFNKFKIQPRASTGNRPLFTWFRKRFNR